MADTIKTGTTPIEEGALMPKSLQFESEPWTLFYLAGETIRELERAQKNAARTGCLHERTTTLPDATPYSGIGGRLLLVGSPIF